MYRNPPSVNCRRLMCLALLCLGLFCRDSVGIKDKPRYVVPIEDYIDLDDDSPPSAIIDVPGIKYNSQDAFTGKRVNHIVGIGSPSSSSSPSPSPSSSFLPLSSSPPSSPSSVWTAPATATGSTSPRMSDVIFDDDDIFVSGSGSGSGDSQSGGAVYRENGQFTPTTRGSTVVPITEGTSTTFANQADREVKTARKLHVPDDKHGEDNIIVDHTFIDTDLDDSTDDVFMELPLLINDVPAADGPGTSNDDLAVWSGWSPWIKVGISAKVRVRTCRVKGQQVSEDRCQDVTLQIKTCDAHTGQCGQAREAGGCSNQKTYKRVPQDSFVKAPPPPPRVPEAPPRIKLRPHPDECLYSLYDNFRQKFIFTRWNLTALIAKSKVKRWCDKKSGQYLVMATPLDHCRRYYKDLCKVTKRCRVTKPPTEVGDFAEGCWRTHVYGERLPVGVSNKQMKTYFICQRFALTSRAGATFGYKHTYFGTLYDINLRAPVMSLVKITSLGDDIWPETDYFIEHGLMEDEATMMWLFKKPRKGMLTLSDLDRCYDDQSCDVGLRQVLPEDYSNSFPEEDQFTPTHLVWPELMPSDPGARLATFTLTNIAPMLTSLYKEWHAAVIKVRQFALDQCHVTYNLDLDTNHPGQFSTHRTNKSALYIVSGVLPNVDPVVTTGHEVRVPFMFWMSGCCVQHHTTADPSSNNKDNNKGRASSFSNNPQKNNDIYMSWEDQPLTPGSKTNVTAFAVYIHNTAGSHVIWAPILQLEMLLQDMYKVDRDLDDVTLFPGHGAACRELRHDASQWFKK